MAIWNAGDDDELRKLRFKRLDTAHNDHDLAIEVLSAIRAGKQEDLRVYVLDRRAKSEPANIARAIMVAGFNEETPWGMETLAAHKNEHGFLSNAYNSAKYSIDRLRWSRHWAKQMRDATSETDLWRYAILLGTIVDGRFQGSEVIGANNNLAIRFGPSFDELFRRRVEKWKDKREKKLFGMDVPNSMFLAR
jgi:hypothetical protein